MNNPTDHDKSPVYIVDTSVLYIYLAGEADFQPDQKNENKELQSQISYLFKNETVVVPNASLVEMLGKFFHEKIDLANYDNWYRTRRAVFSNRIINYLYDSRFPKVSLQQKFGGMMAAQMGYEKINKQAIKQLNRYFTNKKRIFAREPKLLDGADASIVSEAMITANENQGRPCYLVSKDIWMQFAIEDIRRRAQTDQRFPRNLEFLKIWDIGKKLPGKPAGKRKIVRRTL